MVEPADQEFLRSIFLMEAWETVAALEDGAAAAARGELDEMYVVTHRLKGAASLHGYADVAALASELEDLLGAGPVAAEPLARLLERLKRALDDAAAATPLALASPAPRAAPLQPTPTAVLDDPIRRELAEFFASNADVVAYFLPEATEHLEAMTTALLALERGGGDEDLARLFRSMHTIKGAAYVVGCVRVGELAHRAEDLLVAVREGDTVLSPPILEALFATVDVLKLMLGLAPNPAVSISTVAADLRGRLESLLDAPRTSAAAEPEAAAPAAPAESVVLEPAPAAVAAPSAARPRPGAPGAAGRRPARQSVRV
jgi:chemosensory pili system protein ChpA (sensor histidine kinase/response regulator)